MHPKSAGGWGVPKMERLGAGNAVWVGVAVARYSNWPLPGFDRVWGYFAGFAARRDGATLQGLRLGELPWLLPFGRAF